MKKRILAIALALAVLLPVFAVGPFAATPEEEAEILLEQTRTILDGGKFTLKMRGSPLPNPPSNGKMLPVVFVSDGDRMAFEATLDWVGMLRATGTNKVRDTFSGWVMQLLFGKKVRLISEQSRHTIAFINRRFYMIVPESPDIIALDISIIFDIPDGAEITVSEPVIGGKKYLCAALENDDGITMSYYYLNGQLKRITASSADVSDDAVIEVDSFSAAVDQNIFSTKWMLKLTFKLFNLF